MILAAIDTPKNTPLKKVAATGRRRISVHVHPLALSVISDVADVPDRRAQISGSNDELGCPEQKLHVDGVVPTSLAVVLRSEAQGQRAGRC